MMTFALLALLQPITSSLDESSLALARALPAWKAGLEDPKKLARLYRGANNTTLVLSNTIVTKPIILTAGGDPAGQIVINGRTVGIGGVKGLTETLKLIRISVQQPEKPFDVTDPTWVWPPRGLSVTMRYLSTTEPFLQVDVIRELADRSPALLSYWRITNLSTQPVAIGRFIVEDGSPGWSELGDDQWPVRPTLAEAPLLDAVLPPRTLLSTPRFWHGSRPEVVAHLYAPWAQIDLPGSSLETEPLDKVTEDQITSWQGQARKGDVSLRLSCPWPLDEDRVKRMQHIIGSVKPKRVGLVLSTETKGWIGWEAWRQVRFLVAYARKMGTDVSGLPVSPFSGAH